MKREPRLERLEAASRELRRRVRQVDRDELEALRGLLERVLQADALDAPALTALEKALLT